MKKLIKLEVNDEVQFGNSVVKRIDCYPEKIKLELMSNGSPESSSFLILNNGIPEQFNIENMLIIELIHDWDVVCEDRDLAAQINLSDELLGNPIRIHRLGEDISMEFCKEFDPSSAHISNIRYLGNEMLKFELSLHAPDIKVRNNDDEYTQLTGPFRLSSSRIQLLLE